MRYLKIGLLCLVLAALNIMPAFAQEDEALSEELVALFDYDQSAPVEISVVASETRGDITVQDITFTSPVDGAALAAYLVTPPGEGPFAGVLYVHWYESESALSNRRQFLDEAVALASEGVVSLLPETLWESPEWYREGRTLDTDYADTLRQTINLRRALDVLAAQPHVDAARLAYVGHDFGAMYGAILAGVDRRPVAYTLIAGTFDFNEWMLFGVDPNAQGVAAYREQMGPLAPVNYLPFAAPAFVLYQFGGQDPYTPRETIDAFFAAGSPPKLMRYYPDEGHEMGHRFVRQDRESFLRQQLALTSE